MHAISRRHLIAGIPSLLGLSLLAACGGAPASPTAAPAKPAEPTKPAAPAATTAPAPAPTAAPAATTAPAPAPTTAPAAKPAEPTEPAAVPAAGGTVTATFYGETNPWTTTGTPQMINMIFNRLVERRNDYATIVPALAESWKVADDGLTYTFTLRKDVKWHDGQPFTAKDVVWSYQTLMDPKMAGWLPAFSVYPIKGAKDYHDGKTKEVPGLKAVDDYTVQLTTEKPTATFLAGLTSAWILPKHHLESVPVDQLAKHEFFTKKLIGTGAFMFKEFVADQHLILTRNPNYFRGAPKIETMIARKVTQPSVAILGLDRGEFDIIDSRVPDDIERLKGNAKLEVWPGPPAILQSIGVNIAKPYLADKRVRQALVHAIDRETMIKVLWKGAAQITHGLLTSWVNQSGNNKYEYNPDKAKQLLKEANWNASQSLELMVYYTDDFTRKLAAAFQQYWKDVGVTTTIRQAEFANLEPDFNAGKWDLIYQGSAGGSSDPNDMNIYFSSKSEYNKLIRNPELDKLFDEGLSTLDQAKRAPIYQQLAKILNDENYWIFMWAPLRYWAATKQLQGVKDTLGTPGYHPSVYHAEETWTLQRG